MAYFIGDLYGNGAHDDAARRIGENGRKWAEDHVNHVILSSFHLSLIGPQRQWRYEDMEGAL